MNRIYAMLIIFLRLLLASFFLLPFVHIRRRRTPEVPAPVHWLRVAMLSYRNTRLFLAVYIRNIFEKRRKCFWTALGGVFVLAGSVWEKRRNTLKALVAVKAD